MGPVIESIINHGHLALAAHRSTPKLRPIPQPMRDIPNPRPTPAPEHRFFNDLAGPILAPHLPVNCYRVLRKALYKDGEGSVAVWMSLLRISTSPNAGCRTTSSTNSL